MGEEETSTERGRTLQAEGERLGKSVADIRGPCSLLSLGFVTEKRERQQQPQQKSPRCKTHGPGLTRVRLRQRGLSGNAHGGNQIK